MNRYIHVRKRGKMSDDVLLHDAMIFPAKILFVAVMMCMMKNQFRVTTRHKNLFPRAILNPH